MFFNIKKGGVDNDKYSKKLKQAVIKHGAAIASLAFAFVFVAANTSCGFPFYEPKEPEGLESFKRFNN